MDLLIAILMCLNVYATQERLNDSDFVASNQDKITLANRIIEEHWYHEVDGGVVVDVGTGQ